MRILIIFIIQCLAMYAINAQVYELNWKAELSVHHIGEQKYMVPQLNNKLAYNDEINLPHFHWNQKVAGPAELALKILNEVDVNPSDLGDIKLQDIPSQPVANIAIQLARNEYIKSIDVVGLYRDQKRIKKILSFEVISSKAKGLKTSSLGRTAFSSVLGNQNGDFYKISVDTTGIYKIDKKFLKNHNIPIDFDPRKFKIYGNGGMMLPENPGEFRYQGLQEVAIEGIGLSDGVFDDEDYYLFYAQGPNGLVRNPIFPDDQAGEHSKHLYEDKAYYFINVAGPTNSKRITSHAVQGSPAQVFDTFDQMLFYENDSLNLYQVGRLWVGESFFNQSNFVMNFEGTGALSNPQFTYQMVGTNAQNVRFNFLVNGEDVAQESFNSGALRKENGSVALTSLSYPIQVQVNVDNALNPSAGVYLDYFRLNFTQELRFGNQPLGFRWLQNLIENQVYGFTIAGNPTYVWDVSDRVNATLILPQNGVYTFQAKSTTFPNEFIAFDLSQAKNPIFEEVIANQNLSSLDNIDYVIVTYPAFISQAERLAQTHQRKSGVNTAVVTTTQIYNAFSSGSQDISAIRDFFKYLYDKDGALKYALLLGDSSYDFKDRIANNTNMVPSYQSNVSIGVSSSFVSDDFFGILDDADTGLSLSQLDIAVGRLPADDVQEAEVLIGKTLSYLNANTAYGSPFGDWRTKITFVVDDDNPGQGNAFHTTVENKSAQYMEDNFPFYTVSKLYADVFEEVGTSGGLRYPQLEKNIVNAIESGTLLLNYFGHGGINGWAQERIFTQNHVKNLTNLGREYAKLPVLLTVTCDFTVWDIPEINSGGEMMIKNTHGGAVAMLTTSREIPVSYGLQMNDIVIKELFTLQNNEYLPIGEALRRAKLAYSASSGLKLNLIGDPLLSLARPSRTVSIDKINGIDANQFSGTIQALDFVSIEGSVLRKNANTIDPTFKGKVSGTLFDKAVEKTTLNNNGNTDVLTFTEQTNAIYRGGSQVENGEFKFEFYVPKDINFDVGDGKLLFYVYNEVEDGVQANHQIKVGGINPNSDVIQDDQGPVVGLYMNNLNFAHGGITDRNPYLLACITDSTGINATGAGIGHDITQMLDRNINATTVLNDFFEGGDASPCINPNVKDFQKGRVLYKLNNLDLGEHTINFRVWDINNNSTNQTLNFIVMEDGEQKLHIKRLLNWPNPFTNLTYFHFEHNCPDILDVQVQIFTVSGKLVKTIRQTVSAEPFREGYRTGKFAIPWDGLDDFGHKIGKGVYIYKTSVKGTNGETCKGQAQAVEKLVILK